MSIRLEQKPFEIDGRVYQLRCNMAVLDRIETSCGNFAAAMELPARTGMAEILAAMLNDYAEDMGWEQDWTAKTVKKKIPYVAILDADVLGMFTRAAIPASAQSTKPAEGNAEPDSGN